MDECHVGKTTLSQGTFNRGYIGQFIFRTANSLSRNSVVFDDLKNTLSIRAIDDDEPLALRRRDRGNNRLNSKRTTALH